VFHSTQGVDWLVKVLFWGLEYARDFCACMDDVPLGMYRVHEGGAIIDVPKRTLLFHSWGDEWADVPSRRVLLEILEGVWCGWNVQWVSLGGLHRYLVETRGLSENEANDCFSEDDTLLWYGNIYEFRPDEHLTWTTSVLSARRMDGTLRFLVADICSDPPMCDPKRLTGTWYRGDFGAPTLDLSGTSGHVWSGTHVDLAARTIDVWSASRVQYDKRIEQYPSYRIINHDDAFEHQLGICGTFLRFPVRPEKSLLAFWYQQIRDADLEYYGAPPVHAATRHAVLEMLHPIDYRARQI